MADPFVEALANPMTMISAIPPWIWVFVIMLSIFSVIFVWMVMYFIWPMRNSFAKYIVKAKRDNKPVVFLDCGKYFRCVIGENKVGSEIAQIIRSGSDVIKAGSVGGMKPCEGVLMGVGEEFRSMIANVAIIDLMELLEKKGWSTAEADKLMKELHENLRIDLGYINGADIVKERYKNNVSEINSRYDLAIERLKGYPAAGSGQASRADNKEEQDDGQDEEED